MPRFFLLAAALLISQSALAFDQQALIRIFFSVVLVRGYDANGGLAYGSGVVVAENKVVTNCHVLRKTAKAWISQGEDTYPIQSVQADPHRDLCLLSFDRLPLKPVEIGKTTDLSKGDEVMAIGHSNGVLSPITSGGQVKSLYPFENGNVVRTNARFAMGASGSPLFDAQGRLIGINTFKTPGRTAYFYAMPVEWLEGLDKREPQTQLPISGQAFWELEDAKKPYFMQVALPQLHEEWSTLQDVSLRWITAEPANAEAWYELGVAQEGLGETNDAEASYRKAASLDPRHSDALFRLGVFASQRGDETAVHQISTTLTQIDREMAFAFNKAVGCEKEC